MRERISVFWGDLRSSFWFVPTLMALGAALISVVTIDADRISNAAFANSVGFIWPGGAEGARSLLSTIAGSMITVADVVFSITIVALTLASSQFGPRLLRNFVRDRGNQITLGTFISTFLYCVLVLRTVRVKNEGDFVPFISVTCGVALAVASIGVLIFFIHHVSRSIQAEFLIANVGEEFRHSIEKHFPEKARDLASADAISHFRLEISRNQRLEVFSENGGYIQGIARSSLIDFACRKIARVELMVAPGDFVLRGDVIANVWMNGACDAESLHEAMVNFFEIGSQRTESQDVRYGGRQLSEIAARSLSPGINDPYTAMGCIDWGTNALSFVVRRETASGYVQDAKGVIRLKEMLSGFDSICSVMMEPIIAYGLNNAIVSLHLIVSLQRMARYVRRLEDIQTLQGYGGRIGVQCGRLLEDEIALNDVKAGLARLQKLLTDRELEINNQIIEPLQ
jgi:uncharacterized membrane protein